jgi:hypothetical protein
MTEVNLVKHFTDLASATHRIGMVLNETWKILKQQDENNPHLNTLADAIDPMFVAAAELDRLVFDLMLDAEDDITRKEKNNG